MSELTIVRAPGEMQSSAAAVRAAGQRIVLVPTMGYLHAGHVSLLEEGRRRGDCLVLSIFVNPTQFGPREDLTRYPSDLDGDLAKARAAGVDLAFIPDAASIYPPGYQTYVQVRELELPMCGASRPGHFVGVATVVLKLFNLVSPHVALFGEKDFQQLQLIRRMVRDLHVPVEIVGLPIIREPDGLAMSSRNSYLSADDRQRALALSQALAAARTAFAGGERSAEALLASARAVIDGAQGVRLDYLELRDAESLAALTGPVTAHAVMAVAAFVGGTRLIDNQQLSP